MTASAHTRMNVRPLRRRAGFAAVLAAALLVPAAAAAITDVIEVRATPVPLNPQAPKQSRVDRLDYLGGLWLRSKDPRFGGFSGLTASADGSRLLAVSDHGYWLTAGLEEGPGGHLLGLRDVRMGAILDEGGVPLGGRWRDAEAVEKGPAGSLIVAFENRHRLWRYDIVGNPMLARAKPMPRPRGLDEVPSNGGMEALTVLPDGRLLVLTENALDEFGNRLGWVFEGAKVSQLGYVATGLFKPTDLSVLPSGDVLLLERRFTRVGGLAARLSRIPLASIRPRGLLDGQEIAVIEPPLTVDNMEGVAVVEGPAGEVFIYILSDDNYRRLQRTILMKFRLVP